VGRIFPLGNYRAYWVPRQGNSPEEWEDAFACNTPAGRFAIADGASESIYAGEWARLLCEEFVADSSPVDEAGPWLGAAQRRWRDHVRGQPAPWHVAEKLDAGAFATFLGLRIEAKGQWQAVATGDSCLFLVRDNTLRAAFPVEIAAAFGTRPDLIGSRQRGRFRAAGIAGTLQAGDRILLMTDALAEWFLAEHEGGHSPWREFEQMTDDGFAHWVDACRKDRRLKNDDATLVVIETGGDG
jgi:hypothetical protein